MPKVDYNGVTYDSQEEVEVRMWLDEAVNHKIVDAYVYQPGSYLLTPKQTYIEEKQLKTKIKKIERTVFQEHRYSSDFKVWFNYIPFKVIPNRSPYDFTEFDVKGSFQMYGGDRSFSISRKLVYEIHGVYINKIIPKKLFKETWCPEGARYSPVQKKERKCYEGFLNIDQFIKSIKSRGLF